MEKKLYVQITSGEESYYFTKEEGLRLLAEEFDRVNREGREDELGYEWSFEWLTEEEYNEMQSSDKPSLEPIQLPDAERLREALEKISEIASNRKESYAGAIISIINEALSQNGDGWVRVEDGLPDTTQYVLVNINDGLILKGISLSNGKWRAIYSDGEIFVGPISKVTHWRPLPSPPQPINP